MGLVFIILIGIIIALMRNNNNLSDEIYNLKRILSRVDNFCPNCGFALNKNHNISNCNVNYNIQNNVVVNNREVTADKTIKHNNKEIKNSLILISGSILIILSAIIFLTSTWNITHNFFKTIVIILMLGVFLAASYIADKVFKLKQTSNAFYYIALAYLPILLLSIALFSLFGKYLSLYGLGRYIYLTISSFLVSGIYYYNAIKKDNYLIAIFSMIFNLLGVNFMGMIFNNNSLYLAMIMLLIYNLILIFGYKYKKIYYKNNFHLKVINVLTISLGLVTLYFIFGYKLVFEDIIIELLLLINLYYVLVKINNKENIYNYFYPILLIAIFYTVASVLSTDFIIKQLLLLISFVAIYLYEYIKKNEVSIISYLEVLVVSIILSLYNFIGVDVLISIEVTNILGLKSYVVLSLIFGINIFNYLITNKYIILQAFTLTITFIFTILSFITNLDPNIALNILGTIISYIALILISLSLFIPKLDLNFKLSFNWVGHITFLLFTWICLFNDNIVILFLLYEIYTIISYYEGIKKDRDYLKIISYIYFNIAISKLSIFLNLNTIYVIPFTTIIITILEYLIPKLRTNASNIYIMLSFGVSFLLLLNYSIINFIILIFMSIIFMLYIHYYKKNDNYLYLSSLIFIPYVYYSDILVFNGINCMYPISIMLLLTIVGFIYYKGINFYIVLFYIYMFFHMTCIEEYKYISIILLLIATFISYIKKEEKTKDILKFGIYLCLFILYNFIIEDLRLTDITVLIVGSYLILLLASTRTILNKYSDMYKVVEYIGCSIINFIALITYTSEMDGIIYVMFLTLLVIISYVYKLGPIFLVSLIFVLLNVFILTKTFWFSIPWWLYILLIGSILVVFAIYNEIREKKDNNVKNKIENIKNDLNL